MKIINSGGDLNENIILEFEKQLGFTLPRMYRDFLMRNNGGTPEKNIIVNFVNNDGFNNNTDIKEFFELNTNSSDDKWDIMKGHKILTEQDHIPHNILAFAENSGGDLICISCTGDDCGKIYFWDHELDMQAASYDNMSLIANSFLEFIDKCNENVQ